jgi:putative heme transporter
MMERTELAGRHRLGRISTMVVLAVLGLGLVVFGVPRVAGIDWQSVGLVLERVSAPEVLALTAIWLAGLGVQTVAIAAGLPGLSHSRAFFLNLTGSAASNLVPLGGTAGTALNYWSCRRWRFSTSAFLRWALVTNFWDNAVKLMLPGIAVAWLALADLNPSWRFVESAVGGAVFLIIYVALGWLALHRTRGARVLAGIADRVARRAGRPSAESDHADRAEAFCADTRALVRTAYGRLTVGKLGYAAAQALLLWACLGCVGDTPPAPVAFAAVAVERLLSIAVITPGASGLTEMGTVGVLVSLGQPPAPAVAGALLYRAFVFWLEIPAGTALLGAEVMSQRLSSAHRAPRSTP